MNITKLLGPVVCIALFSPPALAACWELKNGSIVETTSNSTAPSSGAKKVMCPKNLPTTTTSKPPVGPQLGPIEARGIKTFDVKNSGTPEQCTDYARRMVPSLAPGLFTLQDKKKIINTYEPKRGAIAIIELSSSSSLAKYGHVAYVEKVTDNSLEHSITISEANYNSVFQRRRAVGKDLKDAARQLNIVGYFYPDIGR